MLRKQPHCKTPCLTLDWRKGVTEINKNLQFKRQIQQDIANKLGIHYSNIPSRRIFDDIWPCFKGPVLFIGWDPRYTSHYRVMCDTTVIDISPAVKPQLVVDITSDNAVDIIAAAGTKKFATVVMNGVVGWGVNDNSQIKKALINVSKLLKRNGELFLGWNAIVKKEWSEGDKDLRYSETRIKKLLRPHFKNIKLVLGKNDLDEWHQRYLIADLR